MSKQSHQAVLSNFNRFVYLVLQGKNDAQQCKAEDSKVVNDKSKDNTNFSVKHLASAKDTESSESSEDESSEETSDAKNDSCDSEVPSAPVSAIHTPTIKQRDLSQVLLLTPVVL